jgi:GTP-binding protein
VDTLLDLAGRHHYRAESGRPGSGNNRTGRSGKDLLVTVPTGTLVYDDQGGRLLPDGRARQDPERHRPDETPCHQRSLA